MYVKNWARQVILENFDFWSRFMKKSSFQKSNVCAISELRMKKRISKLECIRKTEWDRPILKILTFWSKSKFNMVKAFFFFLGRWFGSGSEFWVGLINESNRIVEDGVIALRRTCQHMVRAHVLALEISKQHMGTREIKLRIPDLLVTHGSFFGP